MNKIEIEGCIIIFLIGMAVGGSLSSYLLDTYYEEVITQIQKANKCK